MSLTVSAYNPDKQELLVIVATPTAGMTCVLPTTWTVLAIQKHLRDLVEWVS